MPIDTLVGAQTRSYANMNLSEESVQGHHEFNLQNVRRGMIGAILLMAAAVGAAAQVDPNALAESARQAMAERRFGEAAKIYAELARKFPNEPTLQANLGMALHFSARDMEAIQPLQEASLAMPSSFPAHFALGASLSRLGRYRRSSRSTPQIDTTQSSAHVRSRVARRGAGGSR